MLDDLQARYKGQIYNQSQFDVNPWAGTYYGGAAPWNNPNLIGAIFRSIDRNALSQQLVQGQAALSGSIPPVQQAFAITEKELITYPGYLADHAKDLSEAKAMWAAGGGPALGRILIDIPDIWEGAYAGVSALIQNQLKANLGDQFDTKIEPYSTITGKLVKQQYGNGSNNIWYGWISDVNKLEPSFDLWTSFNSASPQFPYLGGVKIDKVDTLTNQIITELDATKRADLCKQIDVELIKGVRRGRPVQPRPHQHDALLELLSRDGSDAVHHRAKLREHCLLRPEGPDLVGTAGLAARASMHSGARVLRQRGRHACGAGPDTSPFIGCPGWLRLRQSGEAAQRLAAVVREHLVEHATEVHGCATPFAA